MFSIFSHCVNNETSDTKGLGERPGRNAEYPQHCLCCVRDPEHAHCAAVVRYPGSQPVLPIHSSADNSGYQSDTQSVVKEGG